MRNNVSQVFPKTTAKDFTAIILAAGESPFIKSGGSNRSLVSFYGTTLINHQISTLKSVYPNLADIIVVLGYDHENTYNHLPKHVRTIVNERWAETSSSHSLSLALKATNTKSAIVISGDIFFDHTSLILPEITTLTIAEMKREKVGVSVEGGKISHMAYGLPDKWGQISYIIGTDLEKLRKRLDEKSLLFESINKIVGDGLGMVRKHMVVEINSQKDIDRILNAKVED